MTVAEGWGLQRQVCGEDLTELSINMILQVKVFTLHYSLLEGEQLADLSLLHHPPHAWFPLRNDLTANI